MNYYVDHRQLLVPMPLAVHHLLLLQPPSKAKPYSEYFPI
jgi:hypothetical protein